MSVIRSFIFFNIKYEYNITLRSTFNRDSKIIKKSKQICVYSLEQQ